MFWTSQPVVKSEVPVFNVNFYLMGKEEVDQKITVQIGENIEYLNQEFEGRIKFRLNRLFMDPNHAYIPQLHEDFVNQSHSLVDELTRPIEITGGINVFLFETYSTNDGRSAMMGFTPVLSAYQSSYAANSPRFDRLFIAYPGLSDKSTLVHEMGHFFGLSHPWSLDAVSRSFMGLASEDELANNHMTYNANVNRFTTEQLDRM
ncbi:MAG: hypothetical protein AAFR14_07705 [Bacteroidota bacterium]